MKSTGTQTASLSCDIAISPRYLVNQRSLPTGGVTGLAKRAMPVSSLVTGVGWLAALPVGNSLGNQSISPSVQTQIVSVWSAETGQAILPPQYIIFIFGSD